MAGKNGPKNRGVNYRVFSWRYAGELILKKSYSFELTFFSLLYSKRVNRLSRKLNELISAEKIKQSLKNAES